MPKNDCDKMDSWRNETKQKIYKKCKQNIQNALFNIKKKKNICNKKKSLRIYHCWQNISIYECYTWY